MFKEGTTLFLVRGLNHDGSLHIVTGVYKMSAVRSDGDVYYDAGKWSPTKEEALRKAREAAIRQRKSTEKALGTICSKINAINIALASSEE